MGAGVLNTYRDLLPLTSATPMITMGEGDTPLVKSNRLGRELGCLPGAVFQAGRM